MATLNETPSGNRIRIAFFGLRNAGKSTLVNAFCGQRVAIVSDTPGTTTDPVSKAMEILPLGPCLITDTAGLDDVGPLGAERVKRTLDVLATTDIAIWVDSTPGRAVAEQPPLPTSQTPFLSHCHRRGIPVITYHRGESVEDLRTKIAGLKLTDEMPGLLDGIVKPGDCVICVCPIDESAPKGRLILPQVQVIRACLDAHIPCTIVQPSELATILAPLHSSTSPLLHSTHIITDSQAFGEVSAILAPLHSSTSPLLHFSLTSFSVLFARQKGDLAAFKEGLAAIGRLQDGDTVLIAEGCTHRQQCNDIGRVKIPKALEKMSGKKLNYVFASGNDFPVLRAPGTPLRAPGTPSLIIHCGGCMLTRREVLRRIALAQSAHIPILNYGLLLAAAQGVTITN